MRCDAAKGAEVVRGVKGNKRMSRSMGKEDLGKVQADLQCVALRLVYYTATAEAVRGGWSC